MGDFVGKSSGYLESLPKEVHRRINALKNLNVSMLYIRNTPWRWQLIMRLFIQKNHEAVEKDFNLEFAALERKYHNLFTPIYQQVYIYLYIWHDSHVCRVYIS